MNFFLDGGVVRDFEGDTVPPVLGGLLNDLIPVTQEIWQSLSDKPGPMCGHLKKLEYERDKLL